MKAAYILLVNKFIREKLSKDEKRQFTNEKNIPATRQ